MGRILDRLVHDQNVRRTTILALALAVVLPVTTASSQEQQAPTPPPSTLDPPTRADLLRGQYGRYRANNDLLFYHLDVRVDPEKKSITGKNTIRFRMLADDTRIQLDLAANLNIDRILLGSTPLKYERDLGTVYVDFPSTLRSGREYTIDFHYSGQPEEQGRFGGMAFRKDAAGYHWITTACEDEGASVWWPNKDQWRDEVERMQISVSIPNTLVDVSNGRFMGRTDLGDGYTRWDWLVQYPINNYNVALNIGRYEHFSDTLGDLALDFYVLPANMEKGEEAVRADQADARSVSRLLRRIPVREGRLQADRSPVRRHGTPERGGVRQRLRERLPQSRLDRHRHQPQVRLHHHPRERPRVVRQRRVSG
jgi:hypothetical protein